MEKDTWFILGNGIEMEAREIEFFPNLKIAYIESAISIFDLAAVGAVGFREWAMLEPISSSCRFEIISMENDFVLGYDTLNRAWLLNTLLVLRKKINAKFIACSSYSWNEIAGFQKRAVGKNLKLPPFKGSLLDFHMKSIQLPQIENSTINEDDVLWIKKYYEIANSLAAENNNFRFALETISSWRYSKDIKSAVAIIWAAIESVIGVSSEIVFRLSLNISSLLEERGEARIRKFNEIKKLYGLRSKVVHGSDLKPDQLGIAISTSILLLSDLVIYMIEKNKVIVESDFEKAIFY